MLTSSRMRYVMSNWLRCLLLEGIETSCALYCSVLCVAATKIVSTRILYAKRRHNGNISWYCVCNANVCWVNGIYINEFVGIAVCNVTGLNEWTRTLYLNCYFVYNINVNGIFQTRKKFQCSTQFHSISSCT